MFADYAYFVKRPIPIRAVQLDTTNLRKVATWIKDSGGATAGIHVTDTGDIQDRCVMIGTLEGVMRAPVGSWIIQGVQGEFYPCADNIFRQTYDWCEGPG